MVINLSIARPTYHVMLCYVVGGRQLHLCSLPSSFGPSGLAFTRIYQLLLSNLTTDAVHTPNVISIGLSAFAELMLVSNKQTYRQTTLHA